jgi:hypothetical protein
MTARCIAIGERQPVRRRQNEKAETKVEIEGKWKVDIPFLSFPMICTSRTLILHPEPQPQA